MFISQVIFEGETAIEDRVKGIVEKKLAGSKGAPGYLSAECWRMEKKDTVGYALVTRWETKQQFQAWLAEDHKGRGHGGERREQGDKPAITKTGYQFELVEN